MSLSLVALADLVPVLGGHIVIGTERKDFFPVVGVFKASPIERVTYSNTKVYCM